MILQKKNIHMVKVYDNIIPNDVCQKLIGIFETNVQHQHFINENNCPGIKQGGVLNVVRREIELITLVSKIPESLEANLDGLETVSYTHLTLPTKRIV